ncbi:MAG TPA: C39 family peptidase [Candidatus Acidoferrum sp.]|nr:C39 family peptidase [Candidatus Acidoferrum sp.]
MSSKRSYGKALLRGFGGALLVLVFLTVQITTAQILNVPVRIQEQDQWCWAGSTAATLAYYGHDVAQCTIAEYTRSVATWHNFGSVNCCVDPSQGCNYWNYNWGYAGSMEDILSHWGVSSYGYGSSLSISQIQTELAAGRPFIFRWGWWSGGGHFLVGDGLVGSSMYYMNPWFGEGASIADYNWVVYGDNHTWTHTNIMTTTPNLPPSAPWNLSAARGNQRVTLRWNRNTEPDFYRYRIYGGSAAHPTTQIDSTTGATDTSKVILALVNGTTYYFRIKAVDNGGLSSDYGNEVSAMPTCCTGVTGNIDGDPGDIVDITDLSALVDYLFGSGTISSCASENDVDGSGSVDIGDLTGIVDFLFNGAGLPSCP